MLVTNDVFRSPQLSHSAFRSQNLILTIATMARTMTVSSAIIVLVAGAFALLLASRASGFDVSSAHRPRRGRYNAAEGRGGRGPLRSSSDNNDGTGDDGDAGTTATATVPSQAEKQEGPMHWKEDRVQVVEDAGRRELLINAAAGGLLVVSGVAASNLYATTLYTPDGFRRLPRMQFLAALGNPGAHSGHDAGDWGLWTQDPGPRGVFFRDVLEADDDDDGSGGAETITPTGWKLDRNDFWLDEHGIVMESPAFPVPPGRYLVTGGRGITTGLTIGDDGTWRLDDSRARLYDVTHLPCRSARYRSRSSAASSGGDNPMSAIRQSDFPVRPGAAMPAVGGCDKQDYSVLLVVGRAV